MEENAKGASELNDAIKRENLQEELARQINEIKAKIRQQVILHIPQVPGEEIEITGIEYEDYVPLGDVDYKGLSCLVSYIRKTPNEQGEMQQQNEHMVFTMDQEGNIVESIAMIDSEGRIRTTPEFEKKVSNAENAELVRVDGEEKYLVRKQGHLQVISEEEREKLIAEEKREREEIAQSYRKNDEDAKEDDGIISITEIEDPRAIARVLDLPLERVSGKYKLVRFRSNKFILVDENNQLVEGLSISELATDIHQQLNIKSRTTNAKIKAGELEAGTTVERKI